MFRDNLLSTAAIAAVMVVCGVTVAQADNDGRHGYKHVLLISVDGMHSIDLKRWIESHPGGNFAKLADNGVVYPDAYTVAMRAWYWPTLTTTRCPDSHRSVGQLSRHAGAGHRRNAERRRALL